MNFLLVWNLERQVRRMNDDLVSRKDIVTIIENMMFESGKNLSKVYLLQDAKEGICRLNTAFDKKKVIEELRQEAMHQLGVPEKEFNSDEGEYSFYRSISFSQAKRIVEKGGIE